MGDLYTNPPQSRNEAILRATIDGTEYTDPPQSRIEDLLIELKEAIEEGGGGGGTTVVPNPTGEPTDDLDTVKIGSTIYGLVTKAVSDLTNYYLKTETYSKTEVDTIAANIKNSRMEVVSSLPTTDIQTNVIYLVPKSSPDTGNGYDEYINLDGTTSGWELIGDTDIDLSGYVTTSDLNTALASYVTSSDLSTTLASYATTAAAFLTSDTAESTLSDADTFPFYDASAAEKKKVTLANLKAALSNGTTKTITVYSAASDTVTFTDLTGSKTVTTDSSGQGSVSITFISGMIITFTSGVAKSPDNLSAFYKRAIELTDDTTAVYVMPDDVCYWWGYKSSEYEVVSTSNGWTEGSGKLDAPTETTNYVFCEATGSTGGKEFCAIAFKTAQTAVKFKTIKEGMSSGGSEVYGTDYACPSKNLGDISPIGRLTSAAISFLEYDVSSLGSMYFASGTVNGRSCKVYALWLEKSDNSRLLDKADITAIAYNEDGPTCKNPNGYKIGEHFYKNGEFGTAKADIAYGAAFTLGTNYVVGDIASLLPTYNYAERATGEYWIDGKPIYQKTIVFDTPPNNSFVYKDLGFQLDQVVSSNFYSCSTGGTGARTGATTFYESTTSTQIAIYTNRNTSAERKNKAEWRDTADFTGFIGFLTIKYTKI